MSDETILQIEIGRRLIKQLLEKLSINEIKALTAQPMMPNHPTYMEASRRAILLAIEEDRL